MTAGFYIANRHVGPDDPPLVIAEIGINHSGSLDAGIAMVDAAAGAGAEIVKHQTHVVEDEMSSAAKSVVPGNASRSIYDIMASCALDETAERKLQQHALSRGLIFISTPFSRAAAERLKRMDVPAYKIGSGECNNYPLIDHIAGFGRPMILSTGMNNIASVSKAVDIIRRHGVPYALLHTTNIYPTPPELVRLGGVTELQASFPDAVVGLSDHTLTNHACFGAVALGACILERHFTDRMDRQGPDIVCSMDPAAMDSLIEGANLLQKERGGHKGLIPQEEVTAHFAYATVVTIRDIAKGEIFTSDNLWVKRPGTGEFPAEAYEGLLGKRAARPLHTDHHLVACDITS
jgi:N-acetylneuraminate synthase